MHPDFLEILRDFRFKNPTLQLYIHTNGGVHDSNYWKDVGNILNRFDIINFDLDGLSDTHHIYRINTKL